MTPDPCDCKEHSGVCADVAALKREDKELWSAVEKLRDRQWQILVGVVGVLFTSGLNLLATVAAAIIVYKLTH